LTANNTNTMLVQAAPASSRTIHIGSYSGTTDVNGNLTVTHGAGFTPTVVFTQIVTPNSGGDIAIGQQVTSVGATTFVIRVFERRSSDSTVQPLASLSTTGYYLVAA
jgi:hypothetical protein